MVLAACEPKNEPEQKPQEQEQPQDTTPKVELQVATFENIELEAESVLHLDSTDAFQSGDYYFVQDVQDYGEWGVYYFGNTVSNKTGKTYDGDYDNDKSISGGAYEGKNFVVWYASFEGLDYVILEERAVVPGMYVNNTPWVVDAILNGDGMSKDGDETGLPFGDDDYFTLTITGAQLDLENEEEPIKITKTIDFDLARGKNYVKDWTYVDLSELGEVDIVRFSLTGSKHNAGGLTTPTYFCFDNFGAKK